MKFIWEWLIIQIDKCHGDNQFTESVWGRFKTTYYKDNRSTHKLCYEQACVMADLYGGFVTHIKTGKIVYRSEQ